MAFRVAFDGNAVLRAGLQVLAYFRDENAAVDVAVVGRRAEPAVEPRNDMHEVAGLLERELNLGILGGHGPLADQRVEGGKVVRHAMRGFAQLQGLLGALLFELLISLGCLSEGAAHLVEHQDRADGERDIELDLNEIEGAS